MYTTAEETTKLDPILQDLLDRYFKLALLEKYPNSLGITKRLDDLTEYINTRKETLKNNETHS